jgi:hypothetical protein
MRAKAAIIENVDDFRILKTNILGGGSRNPPPLGVVT